MLTYLAVDRLGLRFARTEQKIEGGEWSAPALQIWSAKNFFFWTRHLWTPRNFCRALLRSGKGETERPRDSQRHSSIEARAPGIRGDMETALQYIIYICTPRGLAVPELHCTGGSGGAGDLKDFQDFGRKF